jgi:capsular exopolysaccharide synthesis family protein
MGRLYESLKRAEAEVRQPGVSLDGFLPALDFMGNLISEPFRLEDVAAANIEITTSSRLVALTDPTGLAAEKFRALVARLEHIRTNRDLKSLVITSSVAGEGKSLVTGNLAVTLAKHSRSKVLVIEGDLRRPSLASVLGLRRFQGLQHWWASRKENIAHYVYKINGMPLWFLGAGDPCDQPSHILQSQEFSEAFAQLSGPFDWILVDSTPMLPTVDVNLWSRLVDGILLVVREGIAPVKAIEQGLASLDSPKLVGVVVNESSELSSKSYRYRGGSEPEKKQAPSKSAQSN